MRSTFRNIYRRLRILFRSIRFRLALWFAVILSLILVVFSVFVYSRQARDIRLDTVSRLEVKLRQIQAFSGLGRHEPFEEQMGMPNYSQNAGPLLQSNDVLAVIDSSGQVVQKYGPITDTDVNGILQLGANQEPRTTAVSYPLVSTNSGGKRVSKDYIFALAPISLGRNLISFLILGSPVDPDNQLHRFLITLILGGSLTLLVALVGGYWLADRAIRPVKTITQAARQISETDLNRRLNLGTEDELGQLADTFDQMLSRLEAAFNRQRQFTADASHELRTPLTIVNLEAGRALTSKRTPEEYKRALGIIQSENEFMSRLVNDLLTLSRMDAGQTLLKHDELDLSDVALEVVERLAPIATRSGIELSTGELPELRVYGDRQYLGQMLTNLVENAIKYTRDNGNLVRVETGSQMIDHQARAWVCVEDNGPGIPAEHLPHLFDRFYQVDKARSRNPEEENDGSSGLESPLGSGLGLSIVQWIAKEHGGEVCVQTTLGQGSTFQVSLPLAENKPS